MRELPPAAEPARAPALTERPAGRVVAVGNQPEGLAVDPLTHTVAVGLRMPAQLALVDGRSGRVRQRVDLLGPPRHLAHDPATGDFLVPAERADRFVRVSAGGEVRVDLLTGHWPHDAAAVQGRVFVGDERANTVSVVEGGKRIAQFPVATQTGGLSPADHGRLLAAVSVRERVLELYDPRTYERRARVPAGVGPTHVVPNNRTLYVTDTAGGALLVFRVVPRLQLVRRVDLPGGPYGIAVDPVRDRLWVTLTARNEVVELPAHGRPHVLRRFPTPRQPDTVSVDPGTGRVFVTGRSAGVLQLLDPDREPQR